MLHNDPKAQRDFADWIAKHRQDDREAQIRKMAAEYVERVPGGGAPYYGGAGTNFNRMAFPWLGMTAQYVLPTATKPAVVNYESIYVEVDPSISGFTRQIIAENIIREQLDLTDEPGYD